MKTKTEKTKVIFRMAAGNYSGATPEVIALFPEVAATRNPSECLSYCHYGQHGAAVASGHGWRLATPEEYAPLAAELARIGYELEIKTRSCPAYARTRRESLFPVTTLDDKDHASKVKETKKRLLSRPAWKLADCDFTPAR